MLLFRRGKVVLRRREKTKKLIEHLAWTQNLICYIPMTSRFSLQSVTSTDVLLSLNVKYHQIILMFYCWLRTWNYSWKFCSLNLLKNIDRNMWKSSFHVINLKINFLGGASVCPSVCKRCSQDWFIPFF